jgi:hypothetical protein
MKDLGLDQSAPPNHPDSLESRKKNIKWNASIRSVVFVACARFKSKFISCALTMPPRLATRRLGRKFQTHNKTDRRKVHHEIDPLATVAVAKVNRGEHPSDCQ